MSTVAAACLLVAVLLLPGSGHAKSLHFGAVPYRAPQPTGFSEVGRAPYVDDRNLFNLGDEKKTSACTAALTWMRAHWKSNGHYAALGVDGSEESFLRYLQWLEPSKACPRPGVYPTCTEEQAFFLNKNVGRDEDRRQTGNSHCGLTSYWDGGDCGPCGDDNRRDAWNQVTNNKRCFDVFNIDRMQCAHDVSIEHSYCQAGRAYMEDLKRHDAHGCFKWRATWKCYGKNEGECRDWVPCAEDEYLVGATHGSMSVDGNTGECRKRPACTEDQFLHGAGRTAAGVCKAQPACDRRDDSGALLQYRAGGGPRAEAHCESQPRCTGAGQFLDGATPTQRGTCRSVSVEATANRLWFRFPPRDAEAGPVGAGPAGAAPPCTDVTVEAFDLSDSQSSPIPFVDGKPPAGLCKAGGGSGGFAGSTWERVPLQVGGASGTWQVVSVNPGQKLTVFVAGSAQPPVRTHCGCINEAVAFQALQASISAKQKAVARSKGTPKWKDACCGLVPEAGCVEGCPSAACTGASAKTPYEQHWAQSCMQHEVCGTRLAADGSVQEYFDCATPELFELESATVAQLWHTDSDGMPGGVVAEQWLGRARFGWVDYSSCERGFAITRQSVDGTGGWGPATSFVSEMPFSGGNQCGNQVVTEDHYDDLMLGGAVGAAGPRQPGERHRYCVRAAATIAKGAGEWHSDEACAELTVRFEAVIEGQVVSEHGSVPIKGVKVSWKAKGFSLQHSCAGGGADQLSRCVTGDDGKFKLRIFDTTGQLPHGTAALDLELVFAKVTTGGEQHTFARHDGRQRIDRSSPLEVGRGHFDFAGEHLKILDTSTKPFKGVVTFPSVSPGLLRRIDTVTTDPARWRSEWNSVGLTEASLFGRARENTCFIKQAKVCLKDFENNGAVVACDETNAFGEYALAAPEGMRVFIDVEFSADHRHFVRFAGGDAERGRAGSMEPRPGPVVAGASDAGSASSASSSSASAGDAAGPPPVRSQVEVFDITDSQSSGTWADMNYEDRTVRRLRVGAHGTQCRLPLGDDVEFEFRVPGGTDHLCRGHTFQLPTLTGATDGFVVVPAHQWDVTFKRVNPSQPSKPYPEVTDASKVGWFHRLRDRTRSVDLRTNDEPDPNVVWEYRPEPRLAISFHDPLVADQERSLLADNRVDCSSGYASVDDRDGSIKTHSTSVANEVEWRFKAGTSVRVQIDLSEHLKDDLGSCDVVDGFDVAVISELGLDATDRAKLNGGGKTAEEMRKTLLNSLGPLGPNGNRAIQECTEDVGSLACSETIVHATISETLVFGDDHTCAVLPAGARRAGFAPFTASLDECRSRWAALRANSQQVSLQRQWHELSWPATTGGSAPAHETSVAAAPTLSKREIQLWTALGMKAAKWRSDSWDGWNAFSKAAFGPGGVAGTWLLLNLQQQEAAAELGFTRETWGRRWIFEARLVLGEIVDVAVEDLLSTERAALAQLGWTSESWAGTTTHVAGRDQVPQWSSSTSPATVAATTLGFSASTWPRWRRTQLFRARMTGVLERKWGDFTGTEQTHLATLGWAPSTWDSDKNTAGASASPRLPEWDQLSPTKQAAAEQLGFVEATWPGDTQAIGDEDYHVYKATGCFWDGARGAAALSKRGLAATASSMVAPARLSALCEKRTAKGSWVQRSLLIGMPSEVGTFTRKLTATVRAPGHKRVERTARAVVEGPRWQSDLERLPFPEGRPLLTLHDPPGGASFSTFKNVRAMTQLRRNERTVQAGYESSSEGKAGVKGEFFGTEFCLGLPGAMTCLGTSKGTTIEVQAQGAHESHELKTDGEVGKQVIEDGRKSSDGAGLDDFDGDLGADGAAGIGAYEHLRSSFEYTFSYSTSDKPEAAGPSADMFLMPSMTIKITQTLVVQLGVDPSAASCTVTAKYDHTWSVVPHLSGFFFISAGDVERRVMPLLDNLKRSADQRMACRKSGGVAACCGTAPNELVAGCKVPGVPGQSAFAGRAIDSLGAYCETKTGADVGEQFWACMGYQMGDELDTDAIVAHPGLIIPAEDGQDSGSGSGTATASTAEPVGVSVIWLVQLPEQDIAKQVADITFAQQNWRDTLHRNYELLDRIQEANKLGKDGLDGLCTATAEDAFTANEADTGRVTTGQFVSRRDGQGKPVLPSTDEDRAAGVAWDASAPICKMTGLAPRFLMDKSQRFDGVRNDQEKMDEYKEYNVLSFGGGGAKLDFNYGLDGSTDETLERIDDNGDGFAKGMGGVTFELRSPFGIGAEGGTLHGASTNTVHMTTTVQHTTADSFAGFHLEDPDAGDYFVVQIFKDPYYGTPLFFTNGGASSCHHEQGTAHRSQPKLVVEYSGPDQLEPSQPALFKVRLQNTIAYYPKGAGDRHSPAAAETGGPGADAGALSRVLWADQDEAGYTPPTMALTLDHTTVKDGLRVTANGAPLSTLEFPAFGVGEQEVLVEVHRGPEQFRYQPPELRFHEQCPGGPWAPRSKGEHSATIQLAMPMPGHPSEKSVRFIEPCPQVSWSGTLLEEQTFVVTASSGPLGIDLYTPDRAEWSTRDGLRLELVYREHGSLQGWATIERDLRTLHHSWDLPAMPDGRYDIMARTWCKAGDRHTSLASTVITGTVDRRGPSLISAVAGSLGAAVAATDQIELLFDEPIACTGKHSSELMIELKSGSTVLSTAAQKLVFTCRGASIIAAVAPGALGRRQVLKGAEITVTNVKDRVGNPLVERLERTARDGERGASATRPLQASAAALTQEAQFEELALQQASDHAETLARGTEMASKQADELGWMAKRQAAEHNQTMAAEAALASSQAAGFAMLAERQVALESRQAEREAALMRRQEAEHNETLAVEAELASKLLALSLKLGYSEHDLEAAEASSARAKHAERNVELRQQQAVAAAERTQAAADAVDALESALDDAYQNTGHHGELEAAFEAVEVAQAAVGVAKRALEAAQAELAELRAAAAQATTGAPRASAGSGPAGRRRQRRANAVSDAAVAAAVQSVASAEEALRESKAVLAAAVASLVELEERVGVPVSVAAMRTELEAAKAAEAAAAVTSASLQSALTEAEAELVVRERQSDPLTSIPPDEQHDGGAGSSGAPTTGLVTVLAIACLVLVAALAVVVVAHHNRSGSAELEPVLPIRHGADWRQPACSPRPAAYPRDELYAVCAGETAGHGTAIADRGGHVYGLRGSISSADMGNTYDNCTQLPVPAATSSAAVNDKMNDAGRARAGSPSSPPSTPRGHATADAPSAMEAPARDSYIELQQQQQQLAEHSGEARPAYFLATAHDEGPAMSTHSQH